MLKNKILLLSATLITGGWISAFSQAIPLDPQLRTGKLPNGFTYFIRHNEQPKKRVELYLVNKVGSILEDDDQQGLAHFMEHMNFNGTRHFPKNELVDYLQKAGVKFGADLNAYTSFDETVYQLPLPTDNPGMLANGLQIMRDWAQDATLDSTEIEKERGVVLEEERLGKGARDRMSRQYYPVLFNHSRYAERLPIGKDMVLTRFKPEVIRRFHRDWYRPDLQALIIVGDVNVNQAEQMVKTRFSDLKNPRQERKRTNYTLPLNGKQQFMVVTDKEATATSLEVMMEHPAADQATEAGYLLAVKKSLFNRLIDERRNAELSEEAKPAFAGVSISIGDLVNNLDMLSFSVSTKEGQLKKSFEQSWRVLERVKRYGFTQAELERVKLNYLRALQSGVNETGKTPSVSYVKEYQRLFLKNEASPGIGWEYQFVKNHLAAITLEEINALLKDYLASKDVTILALAPEKDRNELPDSTTVAGWIKNAAGEQLAPYKEEQVDKPLFTAQLNPAKILNKTMLTEIGVTRVTLGNGVHLLLKPTEFKNDQVLFGAYSPGGTSLYGGSDFDAARNAGAVISRMGIGDFNPVQLKKVLTGTVLNSTANITLKSSTLSGNAAPQDLETALKIIYMQFTVPRKDSLIFSNTMAQAIEHYGNRGADPASVYADTMSYVLSNYNYRAKESAEKLSKITLQRTYDIYKERFSDASGFTFVFVGNLKPSDVDLIVRYLGALPSSFKHTKTPDLGIHVPAGQIVKKVYKGSENKAVVKLVFSGDYAYSQLTNLKLKALGDILQIKILQRLREAEGEVYSPQVQVATTKYPQSRFMINVQFACAPENADHLVNLVQMTMAQLRENGPEAEDVEKVKAQNDKSIELALKDNSFWLSYLLNASENEEDLLQVLATDSNLKKINAVSLKEAAQVFFSGRNMITFELLPESEKN